MVGFDSNGNYIVIFMLLVEGIYVFKVMLMSNIGVIVIDIVNVIVIVVVVSIGIIILFVMIMFSGGGGGGVIGLGGVVLLLVVGLVGCWCCVK